MSRPTELSPAEAQKLVERIASSYGWLPQSEREQMSPKALELLANVETVYSAPAREYVMRLLEYCFLAVILTLHPA
jgi:hypothetical protein